MNDLIVNIESMRISTVIYANDVCVIIRDKFANILIDLVIHEVSSHGSERKCAQVQERSLVTIIL